MGCKTDFVSPLSIFTYKFLHTWHETSFLCPKQLLSSMGICLTDWVGEWMDGVTINLCRVHFLPFSFYFCSHCSLFASFYLNFNPKNDKLRGRHGSDWLEHRRPPYFPFNSKEKYFYFIIGLISLQGMLFKPSTSLLSNRTYAYPDIGIVRELS